MEATRPSSEASWLLNSSNHLESSQIEVSISRFIKSGKELRRSLGFWHAFSYVVSVLVGSGIFISPVLVAQQTANMGSSLIVWAACGIICLLGALCFCELAGALKKSGGEYIFVKETYGDLAGFFIIWAQTIVITPSGYGALAVMIAQYLVNPFYDTTTSYGLWLVKAVAAFCIFLTFLINCLSTSFVGKTQVFFAVIQLMGVLFLVAVGIWNAASGQTNNYSTMFNNSADIDVGGLSLALYNGLWAYDGWGLLCTITEELRHPERDLQLSIITGIPFVIICYVLVNLAFMSVLSHAEIASSTTMATIFIERALSKNASYLVPIFVSLSCFGCLNGWMFMFARAMLSASREGHLPEPFSYIHNGRRTPIPALLFSFIWTTIWILAIGELIQTLVMFFSFAIWLTYGLALFAVIVLRIRKPELPRPYRVFIGNPIFMSLVSGFLVVGPFIKRPIGSSICFLFLLTAVPVFYAIKYEDKWMPVSCKQLKDRFYAFLITRFNLAPCVFHGPDTVTGATANQDKSQTTAL